MTDNSKLSNIGLYIYI